MRPGRPERPVPPAVLARVEQILAERNVDGKVPLDIACQILDDMADAAVRVAAWPCAAFRDRGMHHLCTTCYPKES